MGRQILLMWLEFFKECMVSLIFLGINLLSLSTTFFWSQLPRSVLHFHSCHNRNFWLIFCVNLNAILKTVYIHRSRLLYGYYSQFDKRYVFIFCSYSIFRYTMKFKQSVFPVKVDLILWDLSIPRSFSLVPSTYGKLILILISSYCISCCDWDKLWLLVILLNILLIMLSWYPFSFNTCFILTFSLCKSSLFVVTEYALLNK